MNARVLGNDEAPQAYVWHFLFKVPDVYACEAPQNLDPLVGALSSVH